MVLAKQPLPMSYHASHTVGLGSAYLKPVEAVEAQSCASGVSDEETLHLVTCSVSHLAQACEEVGVLR